MDDNRLEIQNRTTYMFVAILKGLFIIEFIYHFAYMVDNNNYSPMVLEVSAAKVALKVRQAIG